MITDKQIQNIMADILVIVDTREQKNQHILDYMNMNGIKYKVEKLDTADYTLVLPSYPQIGVDKKFLVEKKNSLDEIAGNFTKDRERFRREFERVTDEHIHLVVEQATWKKLLKGSYRSKFPPKSFLASLMTWNIRYNCPIWFAQVEESPIVIVNILKYELLEYLKENREVLNI